MNMSGVTEGERNKVPPDIQMFNPYRATASSASETGQEEETVDHMAMEQEQSRTTPSTNTNLYGSRTIESSYMLDS